MSNKGIRKKWNVGWGYTKLCNLNCKHCYNSSGKRGSDELTLSEAKKVVDKLKENNVETINYGTGECGLLSEFWDLVKYVNEKEMIQGLTTNGWSVNSDTIEYIKKYMNDIDVSIDYPNHADHNYFRGHPESWNWAIRALDLLKESEVPFSMVTCLHAKNSDEETLNKFLKMSKKYDCDWRINWFRPTGRGKSSNELKLSPQKAHKIFAYLIQNATIKALPDPYFAALLGLKLREGCPCGKDSFRITPTGVVVPCVYFTKEMDNYAIQENNFDTIIKSKPFYDINNREINYCLDCEHYEICKGGCASRAYLEYGFLNAPDAFCYRKAGIKDNPLKNIPFHFQQDSLKVHDNYLCTAIFKAL